MKTYWILFSSLLVLDLIQNGFVQSSIKKHSFGHVCFCLIIHRLLWHFLLFLIYSLSSKRLALGAPCADEVDLDTLWGIPGYLVRHHFWKYIIISFSVSRRIFFVFTSFVSSVFQLFTSRHKLVWISFNTHFDQRIKAHLFCFHLSFSFSISAVDPSK